MIDLTKHLKESWISLGKPGRILAAVSGGADSMALLLALRNLAEDEKLFLLAVHVDHGLRKDSPNDAQFVCDCCREMRIPCRAIRVQVNGSGENAAREKRFEALFQVYRDVRADALALAHHRRDQAETILLHLLRGSGAKGLKGMAKSAERVLPDGERVLLWRPFLDVDPQMLRDFLVRRGRTWREDETNLDPRYLRNYIRMQVMPLIKKRLPEAEIALGRAADVLRDEDEYLQRQAEAFLKKNACLYPPCRWLDAPALQAEPKALQRRILRLACPVGLSFEKTEEVLSLPSGRVANLPRGWRALETARFLHFLSPEKEDMPLGEYKILPFNGFYGDGKREQAMPESLLSCPLMIRRRKNGDRIHPLGARGEKSLQDYLVDKKIDRPFRDHLPLLCLGDRVLWVIGVGAGEEMRVEEKGKAVLIRYEGYLPGEIDAYKGDDCDGHASRLV